MEDCFLYCLGLIVGTVPREVPRQALANKQRLLGAWKPPLNLFLPNEVVDPNLPQFDGHLSIQSLLCGHVAETACHYSDT